MENFIFCAVFLVNVNKSAGGFFDILVKQPVQENFAFLQY